MENRREAIKKYIQENGEAKLKELEQIFPNVSSMTLRRDLNHLEEQGHIIRVHGGAMSMRSLSVAKEEEYNIRAIENTDAKVEIAKKAVSFIETGRSFFLDSGTTMMCLAKILPDENLFILTSGPNIGLEIIKKHTPTVNLIGGQLSRGNISVSGLNSLESIKHFNIDIAFMATSAFSLESGFTGGSFSECELKKAIIQKAQKVILLMDGKKVGKNMPFTFATLQDIDILICDEKLPGDILKAAEENNVLVY